MIGVFANSWALYLGLVMLMGGYGLQSTLLGVRGGIENFSTLEMSFVMAAYFLGYLSGSRLAPGMIRRVGHVRVFAALASFISAVMVLYPLMAHPVAWMALRVAIGLCFAGVFVTAESWLNNASSNENRGMALSIYLVMQTRGIVIAQGMLLLGDPSGFVLFAVASVLVSISFAPILLSISPTPAFETAKPMSLRELYNVSPLGCAGMFLLGGVYSAVYGMAPVYGTSAGFEVAQISMLIASIFMGAMILQLPVGWLSDRMDRRKLALALSVIGGLFALLGVIIPGQFWITLCVAFVGGGVANPLYSLLIAYTNDYLEPEDMASASGGLVFINGVGAIFGPLLTGGLMTVVGPQGFWLFLSALLLGLAAYAAYRMSQRSYEIPEQQVSMQPLMPEATAVAVESAQEFFAEGLDDSHQSA